MKEKRKTQRRYLLYYMRIYDTATRKQIGNLVDISSGGVMVIGEHLIPEGRTTHLRMELTHDVAKKPFMEFSARSKWCNPYITPNLFNTGFEILDLAPEDAEIIQRINTVFGFHDNTPVN